MWSIIVAAVLLFASISRLREVKRFDLAGVGFLVVALVFGSISVSSFIGKRAEAAKVSAQALADIKKWSSDVEGVLRKSDLALDNYRGLASNADQMDATELYQKVAKLRDIQHQHWNELRLLQVPASVGGDDKRVLSDARNAISTGIAGRRDAMDKVLAFIDDGKPGDIDAASRELQGAQSSIDEGLALLRSVR